MIRTRVGYAGGSTPHPTYRNIGDHAEAVELDFDPQAIGYDRLLEKFFEWHNASRKPYARQYMSAVFLHDEEQRASWERAVATRGKVLSEVQEYSGFTWAEDYHQKYYVRGNRIVVRDLKQRHRSLQEFVDSPAATRANAILGGHLKLDEHRLRELGFGDEAISQLVAGKRSFFGALFG